MFAVGTELPADVSGTTQPSGIMWFVESFGNPHEQHRSACRPCSPPASGDLYATWDGDTTEGARTRLFAMEEPVVAAQRSLWRTRPHLHVAVDASTLTDQMAPADLNRVVTRRRESPSPAIHSNSSETPVEPLDKFSWLVSIRGWWRHWRFPSFFTGSKLPIEIRM